MNSSQILDCPAGGGKKLANFSFITSAERAGGLKLGIRSNRFIATVREIRKNFFFIVWLPPSGLSFKINDSVSHKIRFYHLLYQKMIALDYRRFADIKTKIIVFA
jgi:hypothetical protein